MLNRYPDSCVGKSEHSIDEQQTVFQDCLSYRQFIFDDRRGISPST